jgi:hypothetical protein
MKDEAVGGVTEYHLPGAEALLAGTLALMTCYAQSPCATHRDRAMLKIVSNFGALVQHPALSPEFRAALRNVRKQWQERADACGHDTSGPAGVARTLH